MATQSRHVRSVEKAIELLDHFWMANGPMSLTELVTATGWAKSTVHGLLSSMLDSAVVEQGADGKYRLGYHLFELGSSASSSWNVVELAQSRMDEVMEKTGRSVYLARLSGDELILVSGSEPKVGMHISSEVGSRIPLYCTSQGKSILASMSDAKAKNLLKAKGMPAMTSATLTSWAELQTQLELTRELGYAVERGEFWPGLQSVGAPIFDASGTCLYAIGLVEMQNPQQPTIDRSIIELVKSAAQAVSRDMGWRSERKAGGDG